MRVSVVIPTVDRAEAAYNALRHLEYQSVKPHEIIVVDQSARLSKRLSEFPGVRYEHLTVRGLPNARNVGARLAAGDVVLFLDDDIVPDRDLVRRHMEHYGDPTVGGVGGRIVGGYEKPDPRAPVGTFRPGDGKVIRNFWSESGCDVQHLPGGNMSFRRGILLEISFDTHFGGAAIGEETDYCLRVARRGWRLVFEPRAKVDHLHLQVGGVYNQGFEDWVFWHSHNSMLFVLRHARAVSWPLFVAQRLVRLLGHAARRASPVPFLRGLQGMLKAAATHLATRHSHA